MGLRVLLVDDVADRADQVRQGLEDAGCIVVGVVPDALDLVAQVRAMAAEVIVCDLDHPSRDTLEAMRSLQRDEPRPVVMFVDRADPEAIEQAVEAGVAAYVIAGLDPARVKAVIDVARIRFRSYRRLQEELDRSRATLAERKMIERAKGVLMRTRKLSEEDAYRALRRLAMDRGKRLAEVAADVLALERSLQS